jgi:predicted DNA-binding protein
MKKITLDVRPELHYRLRLLSVVLDRSIGSLVNEAVESLLSDFPSVTADALRKL